MAERSKAHGSGLPDPLIRVSISGREFESPSCQHCTFLFLSFFLSFFCCLEALCSFSVFTPIEYGYYNDLAEHFFD